MQIERLFTLTAAAYDFLTHQAIWCEHIAALPGFAPDLPAEPRVLDLGCGPGTSVFVLAQTLGPGASVTGIDFTAEMIERARRHQADRYKHLSNLKFERADAAALPFADASVDLVTGHSFLYLTADPPAVLREVLRVLAPGGTLALMEPDDRGSLVRAAFAARPHLGRELRRPITSARFAASMVAWRLVSHRVGRMTATGQADLLARAGFAEVRCVPTLGGLGMHAVGRRPR